MRRLLDNWPLAFSAGHELMVFPIDAGAFLRRKRRCGRQRNGQHRGYYCCRFEWLALYGGLSSAQQSIHISQPS